MKVYAVTKNLEIRVWNSITDFEDNENWCDQRWVRVCTSRDLKQSYEFPYEQGGIRHSREQIEAHGILHGIYNSLTHGGRLGRLTLAEIQEIRLEINRVNAAAGRCVFNPALTDLLDRELRNVS